MKVCEKCGRAASHISLKEHGEIYLCNFCGLMKWIMPSMFNKKIEVWERKKSI